MKLLQLFVLLQAIQSGAALGDPTFQPTTDSDATYEPTYDETLMPTTKDLTSAPTPVPTVDDETYSPTTEPPTLMPTTNEPTTPVPTIDDETYSPTAEPYSRVIYPNKKSDVDMGTAVYASAPSQSQPAASKPNGNGGAMAAGILVPMFILAAYGFVVYRRKRAGEREEITEADQEHNNRGTESIAHDYETENLQDIEVI